MVIILTIFMLLTGYLMGSVCSAIIVSQLFNLPDPRQEGSRNPGATNVLRLSGKKYAAIVLLGDALKGFIPVVAAKLMGLGDVVAAFTGAAAVIGHLYPIFFGFKGGKGVATALGVLLGLNFLLGVSVIVIWLLVAVFFHYASLASIIAIFLAPIISVIFLGTVNAFPPLMLITILVLYKHRSNITNLSKGTESKIRFKRSLVEDIMEDKSNVIVPPGSETTPPEKPSDETKKDK